MLVGWGQLLRVRLLLLLDDVLPLVVGSSVAHLIQVSWVIDRWRLDYIWRLGTII